jgi:hypothetical protein
VTTNGEESTMSMLEHFKPKQRGPLDPPPPPGRPVARAPSHDDYADEAKRAAQRYLDQVAHIDALAREIEQWRNRAMLAEARIEQLEKDESTLMLEIDSHKQTLAVIAAQYATASKVLLDGFAAIDQLGGLRAKISMPALAEAIVDRHTDTAGGRELPMPSIVSKGPAENEQ